MGGLLAKLPGNYRSRDRLGSRLRGGVIFWNIKALLNNTKSVNAVVGGS